MSILRWITWSVALVLAACIGLASFKISNQVRAPAIAYATGIVPYGTARGNYADVRYKIKIARNADAPVDKFEQKLAFEAYRAEPLSSNALALLAKAITSPQEAQTRQSLLTLAGQLTRRNALLSSELIKSAAANDDKATFFRWLSRSALTNVELRNAYIGAMASVTAREGAVEALTPIVGQSPKWAPFYWRRVAQLTASLANGAKLRLAIARSPWRQTEVTINDQRLVLALAKSGQFDAARGLVWGLAKLDVSKTNMLVNADFSRQPLLPPFDWELAAVGTLGASIDDIDHSLSISAIGGAMGDAASQLLALSPGQYSVRLKLSAGSPLPRSALSLRLKCAEPGYAASDPASAPLNIGIIRKDITLTNSGCKWYRLEFYVALPDDATGIDLYLRDLKLMPDGSGGAARMGSPTDPSVATLP